VVSYLSTGTHPSGRPIASSWIPAIKKFLACERTALSLEDDAASFGEDVIMLDQVHQSMLYKTRSLFLLKGKKTTGMVKEGG
jgi:hypothetical protein